MRRRDPYLYRAGNYESVRAISPVRLGFVVQSFLRTPDPILPKLRSTVLPTVN